MVLSAPRTLLRSRTAPLARTAKSGRPGQRRFRLLRRSHSSGRFGHLVVSRCHPSAGSGSLLTRPVAIVGRLNSGTHRRGGRCDAFAVASSEVMVADAGALSNGLVQYRQNIDPYLVRRRRLRRWPGLLVLTHGDTRDRSDGASGEPRHLRRSRNSLEFSRHCLRSGDSSGHRLRCRQGDYVIDTEVRMRTGHLLGPHLNCGVALSRTRAHGPPALVIRAATGAHFIQERGTDCLSTISPRDGVTAVSEVRHSRLLVSAICLSIRARPHFDRGAACHRLFISKLPEVDRKR